jgi:hypothetical protein
LIVEEQTKQETINPEDGVSIEELSDFITLQCKTVRITVFTMKTSNTKKMLF